jgi:predicted metal-dependent hydrolase
MLVRSPAFDFSDVVPHWAPNVEAVQMVNATGIIPAYIEPFLIKVMRRAAAELDPVADADLLRDIELFNRQEGQHYKMHGDFNRMVRDQGYPEMAAYESAYEADYRKFLNTKSLRWLLAYCEGFESIGSSVAGLWVDGRMEQLLDAPPSPAVELWKWHLAEEFEHRTVAYRVLHRLYGNHRTTAYFARMYGLIFCARHMRRRVDALRSYLLEVDRADLNASERDASVRREKATMKEVNRDQLKRLIRVVSPAYTPDRLQEPAHNNAVLSAYPAAKSAKEASSPA